MRTFPILPILALAVTLPLAAQFQVHLNPKTDQAFEDYRIAAEAKLDGRPRFSSGLKPGQVEIAPTNKMGSMDVKEGMIHDWTAAIVVPGTTVEKALAVLQNYDEYKNIYRGDVTESKLLRHDGDLWQIHLRMVKKQIFTVILNGDFDVKYHPLGNNRWMVLSRSARIAEMDGDRELPPGTSRGFLWRINAYWLIESRPEGVYLECRAISLSRGIPFGLGLAQPYLTTVPRESLQSTMEATLRALR